MADTKISALTSGNPAQSGDEIPIARSGANYKITAGSIASLSSTPPGGSNTQVQFNNSGAFGGSANLTWDGTNVQIGATGALRLADTDSSNYVAFKSPGTVASNVTWTLPSADGTSNQVLTTNGSGTLSWSTPSGSGDVVGPASAVDSQIALFNSTTGKLIKAATTTGLLKASSGVIAAATSGTDYAPATSGTSILKGSGSGGFSNATAGTDYLAPPSGTAILKANSGGALANAIAGTDYAAAPTGTSAQLLANSGSGGFANVTVGSNLTLSAGTLSATGGLAWQSVQTTGFTAVAGRAYPCNTTSAAFTVTLPASPSAGQQVQLVDYAGTWGTNNVTVARNGSNITGVAIDAPLTTTRGAITLTYVDSTQGWVATNSYKVGDLFVPIEYLVVGAGGGGGGGTSGTYYAPAGAGGLVNYGLYGITESTNYSVSVGVAGAGTSVSNGVGGSGGTSSFATITSTGGGGGGAVAQNIGGSNALYSGATLGAPAGSGGAGAGGSTTTKNGGVGVSSAITGTAVGYGGGGAGANPSPGTAVDGGGSGTAGLANRGGGGGSSLSGGSGVVILKYPSTYSLFSTGTINKSTSISGLSKITTVTSGSGNVYWTTQPDLNFMVVGGGGGAGGGVGGLYFEPAGAGGIVSLGNTPLSSGLSLTISVGGGGAKSTGSGTTGTSGTQSSITSYSTSTGGGGGKGSGSGGDNALYTGGTPAVGSGAGGAGAGGNGSGANGGVGVTTDISGSSLGYGGGGGSGPGSATGTAVDGGGVYNVAGSTNRGGGGGGFANGGSGVIIFSYPSTFTATIGAGLTGSTSTVGSIRITTITNGTGTISWA